MHFSVTFYWKNRHEWLDSHAYEVVSKGNTKYVSYLTVCFPIPMIKCSNNQWRASIEDLMFVVYLQLHM